MGRCKLCDHKIIDHCDDCAWPGCQIDVMTPDGPELCGCIEAEAASPAPPDVERLSQAMTDAKMLDSLEDYERRTLFFTEESMRFLQVCYGLTEAQAEALAVAHNAALTAPASHVPLDIDAIWEHVRVEHGCTHNIFFPGLSETSLDVEDVHIIPLGYGDHEATEGETYSIVQCRGCKQMVAVAPGYHALSVRLTEQEQPDAAS